MSLILLVGIVNVQVWGIVESRASLRFMSPLLVTSDCRQYPLEKRHNRLIAINIQWKSQQKSDSIQAWRYQDLLSTVIRIRIEIRRWVLVPRLWYFYRHWPLFENLWAPRRADCAYMIIIVCADIWSSLSSLWQNQWKEVTIIALTAPLTWTLAILWKLLRRQENQLRRLRDDQPPENVS